MEGSQGGFLEVVTSAVGFLDVCYLFTVLGQGGREEQTHIARKGAGGDLGDQQGQQSRKAVLGYLPNKPVL